MILKSFLHAKAVAPRAAFGTLLGAAVFSASALLAPAHAAPTIDFEGFGGPVGGTEYIETGGYYVQFFANTADGGAGALVGNFFDGSDPTACIDMACPVNNASTYYGALNDGYVDLMPTDPLRMFQVKSFDASFIGGVAALSGYPTVSGLLRIQGYFANGTSASETYQLAGPGANGFNFAHYDTSTAFGNLNFVEAAIFGFACNTAGSCSAFTTDRGQFAIDNLTLNAVPEPSSMLLIGLGLVALTAGARRRQA